MRQVQSRDNRKISVEIACLKCGRAFYRVAKGIHLVQETWAAYSHCDKCEQAGCKECPPGKIYSGSEHERRRHG